MTFPRIDHPEFAEFIRRFYGVSRPELGSLHPSAEDRLAATAPDSSAHSSIEGERRDNHGAPSARRPGLKSPG